MAVLWVAVLVVALALSNIPDIGPWLSLGLVALAGWLHWKAKHAAPTEEGKAARSSPSEAQSEEAHKEHYPPRPADVALEAWGPATTAMEVAGEAYRPDAFMRLFHGLPLHSPDGVELELPAALVPDPANPYDSSAVAVWVGNEHVGYLDRPTAARWHPHLAALSARNEHLTVPCRIWAADRGGRVAARVTLQLPAINALRPVNGLPSEPFAVLPIGGRMQVTGEDQYMDVLAPYVTGGDQVVAATLHAITEVRPRSRFEAVEVRIDGERVGVLSKAQSENMLPVVKHLEARGKLAVARAVVRGNTLKADVVLFVSKSQEIDSAWLESLGPPEARPTGDEMCAEPRWDS